MVKKKECYTKKRSAKNGGGNYTTCVEGQKKPKTIKIKRKKKVVKPKKTAQKKLSAGKSVLFTQSGFMNMVGAYAITKAEKARRKKRIESYEKRIDKYFRYLRTSNQSVLTEAGVPNISIDNADFIIEQGTKQLKKLKLMKKTFIKMGGMKEGADTKRERDFLVYITKVSTQKRKAKKAISRYVKFGDDSGAYHSSGKWENGKLIKT